MKVQCDRLCCANNGTSNTNQSTEVKQACQTDNLTDKRNRTEETVNGAQNAAKKTTGKAAYERTNNRKCTDKTQNRSQNFKKLTFRLSHFYAAHCNNIYISLSEEECRISAVDIRCAQTSDETRYRYTHKYFFHVINSFEIVTAC